MRAVLLLIAALLVTGCEAAPPDAFTAAHAAKTVGLLFEHEGVRVYRFSDGGRWHYYAVQRTGPAEASNTVCTTHGKTTTCIDDEVPILVRR